MTKRKPDAYGFSLYNNRNFHLYTIVKSQISCIVLYSSTTFTHSRFIDGLHVIILPSSFFRLPKPTVKKIFCYSFMGQKLRILYCFCIRIDQHYVRFFHCIKTHNERIFLDICVVARAFIDEVKLIISSVWAYIHNLSWVVRFRSYIENPIESLPMRHPYRNADKMELLHTLSVWPRQSILNQQLLPWYFATTSWLAVN